jgi:CO/xanthine dehydrogenase FAD-binding subunit
VDLAGLGLDTLTIHDGALHIGATVTLTRLVEHPAASGLADGLLRRAAQSEGPVNLRNVATVGGVIAAAEADSEVYAALLALDARITVHDLAGATTTPLARVSPGRGALNGLVTVVHMPLTAVRGGHARVARTPADRPIVAALAVSGPDGTRVALCGVAARPVLAGAPLDPPADFKGSATYRRAMAEVVMQRALAEVSAWDR